MNSSVYIESKDNSIFILGEEPRQVLDDTTLTAETIYSINFTKRNKRIVLSIHYNERNSFLFLNVKKINQSKANNSEIK